MIQDLVSNLKEIGVSAELVVVIISGLPISELRCGIPAGFAFGLPAAKVYILAVLGNLLPVVPILLFLERVSERLSRFHVFSRFFNWLFTRTRKKGRIVEELKVVGLILFVALPLPITGAWTGCVASILFGIRFLYAFPAIILGVLLAGVIVTLASLGVYNII
ncbi:MAG: small multi-drug export protein [bacterium]|nr:small multi-drug export protein [bacterium]